MSQSKPSTDPLSGPRTDRVRDPGLRRAWQPPRLVDHGSLRHFVRGSTGPSFDTAPSAVIKSPSRMPP